MRVEIGWRHVPNRMINQNDYGGSSFSESILATYHGDEHTLVESISGRVRKVAESTSLLVLTLLSSHSLSHFFFIVLTSINSLLMVPQSYRHNVTSSHPPMTREAVV